MKKTIGSLALLLALMLIMQPVAADTIVIDNDFSDWEDIDSLVTDEEDIEGTYYCWNDGNEEWDVTTDVESCTTYWTNQDQMIDITDFRMANDDDNLYILMETVMPITGVYDVNLGEYYPYGFPINWDGIFAYPTEFYPTAPVDFDHEIILSYDTDQDGTFDYFSVSNLTWLAGAEDEDMVTSTHYLYQDNGDGVLDEALDTLVETQAGGEEVISSEIGVESGESLQNKLELSNAMIDMGFEIGDTADVQLSTASEIGDATEIVSYTFAESELDQVTGLAVSDPQPKKFSKVQLTWDEVTGADRYRVHLTKSTGKAVVTLNAKSNSRYLLKKHLASNAIRKVKVRAVSDEGVYGPWSEIETFYVPPLPPTGLTATPLEEDGIKITWDGPKRANKLAKYRLALYHEGELVNKKITTKALKRYRNMQSGEYQVKIRSIRKKGVMSIWSEIVEFTID